MIIVVEGIAYEVVGTEDQGDEIVIPMTVNGEEAHESEILLAPADMNDGKSQGEVSLPCMGFSILIGMTMLPMAKKKLGK